jgi:hypothetical protein
MFGHVLDFSYGYVVMLPLMCIRYLIGCDNILAKIHTRNPSACDKVGGVIIMHIDDLRRFALLWLHKSEEVRADKAHYATNITGDIYNSGWISEMYGYSFAAAEVYALSFFHFYFFRFQGSLFFLHCKCNITGGICFVSIF